MRKINGCPELLGKVRGPDKVLGLGDGRLVSPPVVEGVAACRLHPAADAIDDLDVLGVTYDNVASGLCVLMEQFVE